MSSMLVNSAEGLALEKAVEGLMELTRFDAASLTSASQPEVVICRPFCSLSRCSIR